MIKNLKIIREESDNAFYGMKIIDNKINLYIPKAFRVDENDDSCLKKAILCFLKTLNLTTTHNQNMGTAYNISANNGQFALNSYLWLIKDYLENGLYKSRDKTTKKNDSGRVNWKKTLQQTPIVSNGNIIFNDLYVDTTREVDNILVDIHKVALKRSIEYIGWLFNLSPNIIQTKINLKNHLKEYLYIINKELKNTFDDTKKLRLKNILNVLTGVDIGSGKSKSFGTIDYHVVFEKMNDLIFSSLKDSHIKEKFKPTYTTFFEANKSFSNGKSKLNPDTILIKDDTAYILDSKMYPFGIDKDPNSLPKIDSVQKQITYADYINSTNLKAEFGIKNIRNAFLIPYDMENNNFNFPTKEIIQYVGYNYPNWRSDNEEYLHVYIFLIDLTYVIKEWNNISHDNEIDLLTNKIEDIIAKRKFNIVNP